MDSALYACVLLRFRMAGNPAADVPPSGSPRSAERRNEIRKQNQSLKVNAPATSILFAPTTTAFTELRQAVCS